jgi:hypothetical protein
MENSGTQPSSEFSKVDSIKGKKKASNIINNKSQLIRPHHLCLFLTSPFFFSFASQFLFHAPHFNSKAPTSLCLGVS